MPFLKTQWHKISKFIVYLAIQDVFFNKKTRMLFLRTYVLSKL